jgi:2-iminobutanoate/2-iminopropanoate deaminase
MPHILEKIESNQAPKAIGPYSQAIRVNGSPSLIFVSGQLPLDLSTGNLITGDIRILTNHIINNIEAILKASGSGLDKVVRVDIFLTDLKKDFGPLNEEYAKRFNSPTPPARQTVQVSELPKGSPVEISCIAVV